MGIRWNEKHMAYEKIGTIIKQAIPPDKKPAFSSDQIEKLKTASAIALTFIGVAGVAALSAVAPNVIGVIGKLALEKCPQRKFTKKEKGRKLADVFYYLKKSGQIQMRPILNDFRISLTKLGKKRFQRLRFDTMEIERPKTWNGKWWQIAADIPTKKHKRGADLFRQKLKDMKVFPLQRTLWFYPFDPREEIEFIANYYNIGRFVTVMEINRLDREDEKLMKEHFTKEGVLK